MILNVSLLIASSLGYLLFLVVLGKVKVLVAPFVWACLIVLILYGFGLAQALSLGANLALLLGVVLGIYTLWKTKTEHVRILQGFNPLYLLFAAPFVIFYLSIPDNFLFLVWDELSYWAKGQRLIYDSNALLDLDSPISFKNYPPAQQLFQYYFAVSTFWSEKNVLFAQDVFIFSAILAVVGALITRPVWALLVYLTLCTLIYFFHADYVTIYSDSLLAVCFAACLALALKPRQDIRDDLTLLVCLGAFVLVKEVALIFTFMVLVVYAISLSWGPPTRIALSGMRRAAAVTGSLLLCAVPVAVTILSWRWHVARILTTQTELVMPALASFTQEPFRQRFGTTVTGFFLNLLKPAYFETASVRFGFSLTLIEVIFWLLVASVLVLMLIARQQVLKVFLALLVMFTGVFAYFVFLLWTYLFHFTEYEGIRLASFDRYVLTYILAWTMVVFTLLLSALSQYRSRAWLLVPLCMLGLTVYYAPAKLKIDLRQVQADRPNLEKREQALKLANLVKKHIKPGEKVYFIAQNSNGYEKHMFDYSMIPYPASECWSVGAKYHAGDVWTCQQNLKDLLRGYAYLAIYNADARFWQDNGDLFDETSEHVATGVFKVTEEKDRPLRLSPVQ